MHSGADDPDCSGPGCPIRKSQVHCSGTSSPGHIAGSHVLHRLSTPRHPPSALRDLVTPTRPRRLVPPNWEQLVIGLESTRQSHTQKRELKAALKNARSTCADKNLLTLLLLSLTTTNAKRLVKELRLEAPIATPTGRRASATHRRRPRICPAMISRLG